MNRLIKLALLVLIVGLVLIVALAGSRTGSAKDEFRFDAAKLKDTSVWTQVNAEPYYISSALDTLCAAPTAATYEPERKRNPHAATYITVYVNSVGREAMFTKDVPRFPEGSIIVKAKISTHFEGRKPLLYTIMRKREQGYNPKVGDWEFSVVGPNGTDVQGTGKLENCQACHLSEPGSDFVFRPYVKLD